MRTSILDYHVGGGTPVESSAPVELGISVDTFSTDSDGDSARTPILNYTPGGGNPQPGIEGFPQGFFFYWPWIENLTGGGRTDLDGQSISALPADSLIAVVITGRGESQWLRVNDPASPSTNTGTGVIVPTNYDATARPYVLYRQLGY